MRFISHMLACILLWEAVKGPKQQLSQHATAAVLLSACYFAKSALASAVAVHLPMLVSSSKGCDVSGTPAACGCGVALWAAADCVLWLLHTSTWHTPLQPAGMHRGVAQQHAHAQLTAGLVILILLSPALCPSVLLLACASGFVDDMVKVPSDLYKTVCVPLGMLGCLLA
jgi:hypothetical protein